MMTEFEILQAQLEARKARQEQVETLIEEFDPEGEGRCASFVYDMAEELLDLRAVAQALVYCVANETDVCIAYMNNPTFHAAVTLARKALL